MSETLKFALFQVVILAPFILGYLTRNKFNYPEKTTRAILRTNIIIIEPLVVLWCIWGLKFTSELILLPFAGLFLAVLGLFCGFLFSPFLNIKGIRKQTFLISASLANHGFTMGGFLCYFFLGEKGLGLSIIMVLYFIPYVYGFIFPSAKIASKKIRGNGRSLKNLLLDPHNMPLFAMALTIMLRLSGLKRPDINFPIEALLLLSISLYYLSLGINFTSLEIKNLRKEHLSLAAIKFFAVPLTAFFIIGLIKPDPAIMAVIMIQAFMPAAIFSVVTSVLFNLDTKMASSLFVLNTLIFLTAILPTMFICRDVFF
jgi:predicted permease